MVHRCMASVLASTRWGMLLGLACAIASCIFQIGYGASAVLMTAHAAKDHPSWLGSVSDVARALVPSELVNHVFLQLHPPSEAELLESHGYEPPRSMPRSSNGTTPDDDDPAEPLYVIVWFTANAVIANLFSLAAVFFLCSVDTMRVWEGMLKGWGCCSMCKEPCSQPVITKLKAVQYRVTKAHALYNVVSQGITSVLTLPYFCPIPCKPSISFAYLATLGLMISSMKVFESLIHKAAISVENVRAFGRCAWQMCDKNLDATRMAGRQDARIVSLMQDCLGIATNLESALAFSKAYISDESKQAVSLTVAVATFPTQPYGLGISVCGLLLRDHLPKLETMLMDSAPVMLKEAQHIEKEEEFFYWIAQRKSEISDWKSEVGVMIKEVANIQVYVNHLRQTIESVIGVGKSFTFDFMKPVSRLSVDDVMRVADPLTKIVEDELDSLVTKLHQLADNLQLYADHADSPFDHEVRGIISSIFQLLPVGVVRAFVQQTPPKLLHCLLCMMQASKAAGAGELMLEDGGNKDPSGDDDAGEVESGYAMGGDRRFALLTSANNYNKLQGSPAHKS